MENVFESYWFYGDLQYILSPLENSLAYFSNNYLNIFSVNADIFELYFDCEAFVSPMEPYKNCPLLTTVELLRKDVIFDLDYIKASLEAGWNIIVYVDRSKLEGYSPYSRRHQIMICDYNGDTDRVHFCDNDTTGKYNPGLSCSINDLLSSYNTIENDPNITTEWEKSFFLVKPKKNSQYKLDINSVVKSLKKYLFFSPYNLPEDDPLYDKYGGIRSYNGLIYNLNLPYEQWIAKLHFGAYSVLCDHKKLLLETVKTMCNDYGLDKKYIEKYTHFDSL